MIYAIEQADESIMLDDFIPDPGKRFGLIFGNEVNGIDDKALSLADGLILGNASTVTTPASTPNLRSADFPPNDPVDPDSTGLSSRLPQEEPASRTLLASSVAALIFHKLSCFRLSPNCGRTGVAGTPPAAGMSAAWAQKPATRSDNRSPCMGGV